MKNYTVGFGSGDPRGFTGLAPTFLSFYNLATGTTNAPPSIAETIAGKTGIYTFAYGVTQPISFLIDAATTSPGANGRYVFGQIDPADRADEYGNTLIAYGLTNIALGTTSIAAIGNLGSTLMAQGTTLVAQGSTLVGQGITLIAQGATIVAIGNTLSAIGSTNSAFFGLIGDNSSSYGSTSMDPTTVFGFLKRAQEMSEGNQTYVKATGILDFYSRGSTTLLREKTIVDTSTSTAKT